MAQTAPCELPPLILHPFASSSGPRDVLESSRAALMLAGMVPSGDSAEDALAQRLRKGRAEEIRMLCFIGKDCHRWIEQCVDFAARHADLAARRLPGQSFAELLVRYPPPAVGGKLRRWGVDDFTNVFRRAIGLAALLANPPATGVLESAAVLHYHHYADGLYASYLQVEPWPVIRGEEFSFDLYSSGEYSRMLETEWSEPPAI